MDASYDCIVIGAGIVGCATALAMQRAGRRTLILEQVSLSVASTQSAAPAQPRARQFARWFAHHPTRISIDEADLHAVDAALISSWSLARTFCTCRCGTNSNVRSATHFIGKSLWFTIFKTPLEMQRDRTSVDPAEIDGRVSGNGQSSRRARPSRRSARQRTGWPVILNGTFLDSWHAAIRSCSTIRRTRRCTTGERACTMPTSASWRCRFVLRMRNAI